MSNTLFAIFLSISFISCAFEDTLINDQYFLIIERYKDGNVKKVGQYMPSCVADRFEKCGFFLTYNRNGDVRNEKVYFYNERHNKKFLGIKYGWWGLWGIQKKYVLGIRTSTVIVDPCF